MKIQSKLSIAIAVPVVLLALAFFSSKEDPTPDTGSPSPAQAAPGIPSAPSNAETTEIPEEDLRAALQESCDESASGLFPEARTDEEVQAQIAAIARIKHDLSEQLAVSASAEHLHISALLAADPAKRDERLLRAVAADPNDSFLLWDAIQICNTAEVPGWCRSRAWDQRLISLDGQNSEAWMIVAINRYKLGNQAAALDALLRAGTAAETNGYAVETIEMIERGLAAGADFAFPDRAFLSFAIASQVQTRFQDYAQMCRDLSANHVDWAYACLAYGELVEQQGQTDMERAIARSIQKLALEPLGEVDKLAAVEARQEAFWTEMRQETATLDDAVVDRLMFSNSEVFFAYLATMRERGETGARAFLAEEANRLLELQPDLACAPM